MNLAEDAALASNPARYDRKKYAGTSVHLREGDVIVQQAANNGSINRGTQPCPILFVLMDSRES